MQSPRDAATNEGPIERLPAILSNNLRVLKPIVSCTDKPPLRASVALSVGGEAVGSHVQMLGKNR